MFLMVVLIVLLGILAWKWKQKQTGDRRIEIERRTDSASIEAGVSNPAFLGPPV